MESQWAFEAVNNFLLFFTQVAAFDDDDDEYVANVDVNADRVLRTIQEAEEKFSWKISRI